MSATPWTYASAATLAAALDSGEVSAVELTRDAIDRIEAIDGAINAVCVKTYESALESAAQADARRAGGERGPLLGVPMTIKESFNLAGTPTTWGFPDARDFRPEEDALIVARVKAAGAVILGKTNVPLALGDWQSYNEIYGVTNNPFDLARTPGGSSGGSSAALAAGLGALSLGSDIGGSLRVPAHFCGIFAHKPTHSLVPPRGQTSPFMPALPGSVDLSVVGPMARSAEDLETLLDIIAGPDPLDDGVGYRLALPPARLGSLAQARVLVLTEHPLAPSDEAIATALDQLSAGLEKAGARVARTSALLPDLSATAGLYVRLLYAAFTARMPEAAIADLVAAARGLDPDDRTLVADQARGATLSHRQWIAENGARQRLRAVWRALFREFDALICPVTPTAAFPHDFTPNQNARQMKVNGAPRAYFENVLWPGVATLPGLPATAFPLGRTADGLPIGAQIVGPWLEDRTTLALARLIEREFGGFTPPPAYA